MKLRTASFEIRNTRLSKRRVVDMELVTAIMKHEPPLLRELSVNGQTWEVCSRVNLTIHDKLPLLKTCAAQNVKHRVPGKKPKMELSLLRFTNN